MSKPYYTKLVRADLQIRLLAAQGVAGVDIADAVDASPPGVILYCRRNGIELTPKRRARRMLKDWSGDGRAQQMAAMYRQGLTLAKIGAYFNLTRERVRQILSRMGVTRHDGGQRLLAAAKLARKTGALEARIRQTWGLDIATWRALRADGTIRRYEQQRQTSSARAIPFLLTFAEWFGVWEASGKYALCGKGKGHYCMSRIRDDGPYALGNVHIQTCVDNSKEAVKKWKGKTKANRGVFCLYPGSLHPWLAVANGKRLGYFPTEGAAVEARATAKAA